MNINPLFLNSLGGQAIDTDLKSKKFDAPAYLFSDIIKIYTDDKNTDMTASVDIKDAKNLNAGESDEVVDLNNLFEQVNKKIESPFKNTENADLSNVEDSNVTVFKYVFEELGSSDSVDTENELKLTGDDGTHIPDVDINALVSNIINLIQNSGIASSFDKNFNSDSINAFLSNGGNVELNIETSDGVIKLRFEQNGNGSGNTVNNAKFPDITPSTDVNTPIVPPAQNEADNSNNPVTEDSPKQMSLKISVYKDAVKPGESATQKTGTEQTGTVDLNITNSLESEIPIENLSAKNPVNDQESAENIQIKDVSQQSEEILNDTYTGIKNLNDTDSSFTTEEQKNTNNQVSSAQNTGVTNKSDNGTDVKVESEIIPGNKETGKADNTQSYVNTLAEDKNITEISYKEEKIDSSVLNDNLNKVTTPAADAEFNDLPLFSSNSKVENNQTNNSQLQDPNGELQGEIKQPELKEPQVDNNGQTVSEILDAEKQPAYNTKLENADYQKNVQTAKVENNTVKVGISEKISSNENIQPESIDTTADNRDSAGITTKLQTGKNEIVENLKADKPENVDEISAKKINNGSPLELNINAAVKRFINNIIKVKEKVVNPEAEEKPVIKTSNTVSGTLDNNNQSKVLENTDGQIQIEQVADTDKTNIEKSADIQPKMQAAPIKNLQNSEISNSTNNNKTSANNISASEIKTTRQFDIKLNGARSMSSVDLLSKVHKFISDNAFAEKQELKDSEPVNNNSINNGGIDNSTTYLNNLSEFTQSADISLLNNKSNFVLQKQNYKDSNKDSLKNNSESIEDVNTQVKADVKTETVKASTENEKTKKIDIDGNPIKQTVKTTEEDKIITDAEEKIRQNQPVNDKKVFTPDLSLVNPFGQRENGKVEVAKNSGTSAKVSEISESNTKNVEKNNTDNNTGKENKETGNNNAFTLNHTAAEKIPDKVNSIHEEMKFTLPDEKVVKYSKLMPEIKNALSEGVNKSLTISLTPEELGKVKLIVETVDKTVSAKIEVQNEAVQSTIQNNLDNLKQSLSQSGLNINNITVSISYNDNKQQKPGELKKKHASGNDKKIETEEEKISSKNISKTLGYNTYEYLA
jgi:hypothetical protein